MQNITKIRVVKHCHWFQHLAIRNPLWYKIFKDCSVKLHVCINISNTLSSKMTKSIESIVTSTEYLLSMVNFE